MECQKYTKDVVKSKELRRGTRGKAGRSRCFRGLPFSEDCEYVRRNGRGALHPREVNILAGRGLGTGRTKDAAMGGGKEPRAVR